jgi:hypothetical protein
VSIEQCNNNNNIKERDYYFTVKKVVTDTRNNKITFDSAKLP